MQVSVETKEGLERALSVTVSKELVDGELRKQYNAVMRKVNLPGFRKGKVPVAVIKQRYGQRINFDVANKLVEHTINDAIKEAKVNCAGVSHLHHGTLAEGSPFEYTATIEEYPDISNVTLKGETIEKIKSVVTSEDIDNSLEGLRKQQVDWEEVARPAKPEDKTLIDFEGRENGEIVDNTVATNFELVLGSNSMIPGFEEAVQGMKAGDEKIVPLTFPEDYHISSMSSKNIEFKLVCHKVFEPKLPDLDDEFAKKFQVEDGIEALRTKLKESMERELSNRMKQRLHDEIFKKLVEINQLELPQVLVTQEITKLKKQFLQRMNVPEDKAKDLPMPDERFKEQAEKNVTISLLLSEYIKHNELEANDEKVEAYVEDLAQNYDDKEGVMNYYLHNQDYRRQIVARVLEDEAVDHLANEAKLTEIELSYEEVMKS